MRYFRGSVAIFAISALAACSSMSAEPDPAPETITLSSSTSNAPATKTVTPTPPSDGSAGTGETPASGESTGTEGSPSNEPTATTTTPSAPPTEAGAYADTFVRAWGRGDRAAASTYAMADAVSSLFASRSTGGGGWKRQKFTPDGGSAIVTYSDGSDTVTIRVDQSLASQGKEQAVVNATLSSGAGAGTTSSSLPTSMTDYTDAFVRAWGQGSQSAWTYATDSVESTFGAKHPSGGPRWSQSKSTASEVTYRNRDGRTLVLTVSLYKIAFGERDGITGASLTA